MLDWFLPVITLWQFSIRPSAHLSVDTILSPQLFLQFLRDYDETFQLLFPWPEDDHFFWGNARLIFTRVIALWQFFNSKSCLCNSSCSFQWILVNPFSYMYCCHNLKRIILYQGHTWLLFTRVMALCKFLWFCSSVHFIICNMWTYFINLSSVKHQIIVVLYGK